MVDKKNVNPLGLPSDDGSFSEIQREMENCYDSLMDSSFAALGRDIVLHLTPEKVIDSSGVQSSTNALHYNPFMGRAPRKAPSNIGTTRSPATRITHRDAVYKAHIKHGPIDSDDTGGVVLDRDEVMTTTVFESLPHIKEAITATIDGSRYQMETVRVIGLQDTRYIITKWKEVNQEER